MRLVPIGGGAGVDLEGDGELDGGVGGVDHDAADDGDGRLDLRIGDLEDEFVMHLQEHGGVEFCAREGLLHADHGAADNVGGGALDGGVDGGALVKGAFLRGARGDLREMAAAAEHGADIAIGADEAFRLLHIVADAGEAFEIFLDVGAGLLAANAELVGEAEGGNAVNNAEIDRLGAAAHLRIHVLDGNAKHFGRCHGVNVDAVGEGFGELRDMGHVGEDAQLDLGVIRRDEFVARNGDEGRADFAARLGADGDVLDVRLGGREPPCRGRGERERGVDAFGDGVDEAGQRIGIGGFEFGELTPFEDLAGKFMALVSEFLEDLGAGGPCAGGGFLGAGQAHFAEEEIAELFGRAEIEGLAGQRVDIMFEAGHGLGEFAREAGEDLPVDRDAASFHPREHRGEGALQPSTRPAT